MSITREQIAEAINKATGKPDVGPVAVVLPAIIDAVDALANPKQHTAAKREDNKEQRIIKPTETRADNDK